MPFISQAASTPRYLVLFHLEADDTRDAESMVASSDDRLASMLRVSVTHPTVCYSKTGNGTEQVRTRSYLTAERKRTP